MAKKAVENLSHVADVLRSARLKQKLSLEDVAADICVRRCFLEAIEENDIFRLPNQTFAVGFVRSYAKMLGLDAVAIGQQFKGELLAAEDNADENELGAQEISIPVPSQQKVTNVQSLDKSRWLSWLSPIAGLVGAAASWMFISAQMTGPVLHTSNAETSADVEVQQLADIQSRYIEKEEASFLPAPFDQSADDDIDARGSLFFSAANADVQAIPSGADVLTLRAQEDSWLQLSYVDGTAMWSGVLRAGQDYTPRLTDALFLTTSNAGGVFVVSGAKTIGPLGERGVLVQDLALNHSILSASDPSLAIQTQ